MLIVCVALIALVVTNYYKVTETGTLTTEQYSKKISE